MELALGIDFGTSYFKVGLFDRGGRMAGLGRRGVEAVSAAPGWRELPVEAYWGALREALGEALREAGARGGDICAVAYSSQANSFLLLDGDDRPLTPILLWTDTRATPAPGEVQALWNRPDFLERSGQDWRGAEFAIAKLAWLRAERPEVWRGARRVAFVSDYLVRMLTGRAAGDGGSLSLTGLYDQHSRGWWGDALEALGLDAGLLPEALLPGEAAGCVSLAGAGHLDLAAGTPVAVGSLDHHAAALGAGLAGRDEMSESTGTVVACLHLLDAYEPRSGGLTGPGFEGLGWFQLAFGGNGATALEWYQRTHAPGRTIPDLLEEAAREPAGAGGLFARPEAGGNGGLDAFVGGPDGTGHGARVRAILECTAASLRELAEGLRGADGPRRFIATGGGARSDLWLQIKADLLGAEFAVPVCPEPGCLGAAMAAAVAAGWFASVEEAGRAWRGFRKIIVPTEAGRRRYAEWYASRPPEALGKAG